MTCAGTDALRHLVPHCRKTEGEISIEDDAESKGGEKRKGEDRRL